MAASIDYATVAGEEEGEEEKQDGENGSLPETVITITPSEPPRQLPHSDARLARFEASAQQEDLRVDDLVRGLGEEACCCHPPAACFC